MDKIWLEQYPKGVPETINPEKYQSIVELLAIACEKYADKPAFQNFGTELTYADIDRLSGQFAAFLQQELKLERGARVGIMMPNLLQYPIVMFGILRAGLVVTNLNPLYTSRELTHQLNDAGASALVVIDLYAHTVTAALPDLKLQHVIVTEIGDAMPFFKRWQANIFVKYIKRMVKPWRIPEAIMLRQALKQGAQRKLIKPTLTHEDIAFLQYTGGTTGLPKGAVLTHRNMVANAMQIHAWISPFITEEKEIIITALPLYHIFSLTVNCLAFMTEGGVNILITNPRDISGFIKQLKAIPFTVLTGVNTLFNALLNHREFAQVDFSQLRIVLGGGMAVQKAVADRWAKITNTTLLEGYGLTEASPVISAYPLNQSEYNGSIGFPLPGTEISIRDDQNNEVGVGNEGELCVRGPQVMREYWQKPDETRHVFNDDDWLKTGDIAVMDERGYLYIRERKKDMILVSGFNVYPNEVEDVIAEMPEVVEVAVVGVSHQISGEIVKAFIVSNDPTLKNETVVAHCREKLTNYKIPKQIEFLSELPKSNVGKILRRELRDK